MRAVLFMLRKVFSGICGSRVLSLVIVGCLAVVSSANAIQVGEICGPGVAAKNRVFQGGDELQFNSMAWRDLYAAIQRAGVVNPEINFLPVSKKALSAFGMTNARFQALRNRLHTTVGGALYDLVLSTTARHVGMRMGEFSEDPADRNYNAHAAQIFFLTYATAPASESPGSPAWWGNELFGIFPSFRFLVEKCMSPPIGDVEVDPEVCMAREMLSSFGKLTPLLERNSFESVFFNTLARHDGQGSNVPGRVQFILRETSEQDSYPAVTYHRVDYTRVKSQNPDDVVLPMPVFYVPAEELRGFYGILISRTEINQASAGTFNSNGAAMRQIGVSISLGQVEGAKLRDLLTKLRHVLHPSATQSGVTSAVQVPR